MNLLISRFQNWHTKPSKKSHGQIIYLWIEKKNIRDLRNNESNMIERSRENQALHENAENVFNKLLLRIKEKSIYKIFCSMAKKYFHNKLLTRIMYLWIIVMYHLHVTFYLYLVCVLLYIMWITPEAGSCSYFVLLLPKGRNMSVDLNLYVFFWF